MQKLNAREYFVVVIIALITIVVFVLLARELFSENSPFAVSGGEFVSVQASYVLNIAQSALQLALSIIALIYLLKKRRAGWICSFALLTLVTFICCYVVGNALLAGFRDILVIIGAVLSLLFLTALIFLFIPSTLKKFNITKSAIIPATLLLGLLVTFYFFIPE
jgi:hypothetical protein